MSSLPTSPSFVPLHPYTFSHFRLRETHETTIASLGCNLGHFYQMYGLSKAALLQLFEVDNLERDPLERCSGSRYVNLNGHLTSVPTLKLSILTSTNYVATLICH